MPAAMSKRRNPFRWTFFSGFLISLVVVACGQPARAGWLGALSAVLGFALFFASLSVDLSKRRRFFCGSVWFAAVQMVQLSWMTSIEFQGYYILLVYALISVGMGCQFGLLTMLVPLEGKIPIFTILRCAAYWTLMEWMRLFFLCGFSWNPVGLALTHFTCSLQFASVFGIFGLSFWVMLTNLMSLNAWREKGSKLYAAAMLAVASVPYLYGAAQLAYHLPKSDRMKNTIDVALVQTALLPSEKVPCMGRVSEFISPFSQWESMVSGLKECGRNNWDMIIMPEAVVPLQSDRTLFPFEQVRQIFIKELGSGIEAQFPSFSYPFAQECVVDGQKVLCVSNLFWCQTLSNYFNAELIAGLDHEDKKSRKNFNSAFCLKPHVVSLDRYDKQVLLPFAEYLPFESLRHLATSYGIFDFFSHGDGAKVFGEKIAYSPSICYEETFPEIMRKGKLKGARLFVNLTNDNYFPNSSLHKQHLYHARVRAAENGTPLVRSCNSGISAAIDGFGRIAAQQEGLQEFVKGSASVISCRLNTYTFSTLYAFCGEWLMIGFCGIICLINLSRELQIFSWKRL